MGERGCPGRNWTSLGILAHGSYGVERAESLVGEGSWVAGVMAAFGVGCIHEGRGPAASVSPRPAHSLTTTRACACYVSVTRRRGGWW